MSTENGYNGWTNYSTWRVNIECIDGYDWDAEEIVQYAIDNPEAHLDTRQQATANLAGNMKDSVEQSIYDCSTEGFARDYALAFLSDVNWREIARHYVDEVNLYSAGWNMPGYMPESAPALFTDKEQAVAYIMESLEQYVDGMEDSEQEQIFEPVEMESELDKTGSISFGQYVYWVSEV